MEKYYDYSDHIEKAMSSFSNEKTNFVFKRRVLDEMELRTKEVIKRGLGDKKVAHDLIMDEYNPQRIVKAYYEYLEDIKEKKKIKYCHSCLHTFVCACVFDYRICYGHMASHMAYNRGNGYRRRYGDYAYGSYNFKTTQEALCGYESSCCRLCYGRNAVPVPVYQNSV